MRRFVMVLALWLAALPAAAQAPDGLSAADRQAILGVIGAQLEAFQADAATDAFSYASPTIRRMFGNADAFMAMVRQGYAPVYRPRRVEMLDLTQTQGGLTQRVFLVGPDGVAVVAHYYMQLQPDGTWRINGVSLTRADDQAV